MTIVSPRLGAFSVATWMAATAFSSAQPVLPSQPSAAPPAFGSGTPVQQGLRAGIPAAVPATPSTYLDRMRAPPGDPNQAGVSCVQSAPGARVVCR
jgi:hypothetical protein